MSSNATPVRTELFGEHTSEHLSPNASPRRIDPDCFESVVGEGPSTYIQGYSTKVDETMHPSYYDNEY